MKKLWQIFCGLGLAAALGANAPAQTIASQPQNVTVNNASTALFTVGAVGATNYQWQFQGTNISGATNSSLTLENVNTNQAGNYAVVLNNLVTSSNAELAIVPGTVISFVLSGFPGGGASNVDVQLFDHDKPATVQNFLHYVRAGGYTNMFFDRFNPRFVLQGGDYGAADRTNTVAPVVGWNITSQFTESSNQPNPPYPDHIDSEFNAGPLNHNTVGTIAMALGSKPDSSTDPDSARGAFFFNLSTNNVTLDLQEFTVFGRIIGSSNVLQYLSQVSAGQGAAANGEILLNGQSLPQALPGLTDGSLLPVDYLGTNAPGNANLLFCDFTNTAPLPVDTNPPTIAVTIPSHGELLTNSVQGTAADDVGLALVRCILTPHLAADGTYPEPFTDGTAATNYATGTTNWALSLNPGAYDVTAQSQDGAGNLSAPTNFGVTNTAVVIVGNGSAIVTNVGATNVSAVGYPFQDKAGYDVLAIPGTNQIFLSWTAGGSTLLNPEINFTMQSGAVLTATFISNALPDSISFTFPVSNAIITNSSFNITGTISNIPSPPVTVTCQIYSTTTYEAVGPPLIATGTTNWSVTVNNLVDDSYTVQATAVDSAGNSTVITQNFSVSLVPVILAQPQSVAVNNASTAVFSVNASNALSYIWQFNGTNLTNGGNVSGATSSSLTLQDVATNDVGSYTVIASSETVSVTNTLPATLTVLPGTIVSLILTGLTNGNASNVVDIQLFDHDKPATVQNFLHYLRAGAFTNMFLDSCSPGLYLQGGSFGASNQTDTNSPIYGWDIYDEFTIDPAQNPPFPHQIASELNVGPSIPASFGTLAMGVPSKQQIATPNAFFLNLGSNNSYSGYEVFGRILDGTNILKYFNALSNQYGLASNANFLDRGVLETNQPFPRLPVNYSGSNPPANADLIFLSIEIPTNVAVDTNPPVVSVTSPAPGAVLTTVFPVISGTASDDIGLADIICILMPQPAADGTYPNGGISITNYANGATNWSLYLTNVNDPYRYVPPGTYNLFVQSQDGAGNLSPAVVQPLIVTDVVTNGPGAVTVLIGTSNIDAVGYPFQNNRYYTYFATAESNGIFANWIQAGNNWAGNERQFYVYDGGLLTANFVSNTIPNSIAFTYPATNGVIGTNEFNITGTISGDASVPVTITSQIYYAQNGLAVGGPLTTTGATGWSEPATNLPLGSYFVEATAVDADGNSTMITETFSVSAPSSLALNIVGPGTVSGATNGGSYLLGSIIDATATPNAGQLFESWNDGSGTYLNPAQSFQMRAGLTLTATFVSNNAPSLIAFTYPPANGIIGTNAFAIAGTISNAPSAQITFQIYSNGVALSFTRPLVTSGTTSWSLPLAGLPVGSYTVVATAVDPAGGSTLISENFSVAVAGTLRIIIVGNGTVGPVTNGQILPLGTNFQLTATPGSGQAFYTWNTGTQIFGYATQTFTMANQLTLTATFIPSNTVKGVSFTYPTAKAVLHTNNFVLKGTVAAGMKPAQVTCQFFSTNGLAVGPPMTAGASGAWAISVTNLPGGAYFVEAQATNASGKSAIATQQFNILAFSAVQGTYTGLFICTNNPVAPTNSGFLTFTVQPDGIMTGKLEFPGYASVPIYPLEFENIGFTTGFAELYAPSFHDASLLGAIYLDLSGATDVASGSVSSDSSWSSQLICYRAVNKLSKSTIPPVGKYIVSLQAADATNGLQTNGYAALSVNANGAIVVSGALPDNSTFSQSAAVSRDGIWPLYAVPSGVKTNGMLLGWVNFTNAGALGGQLFWYKAPQVGNYYKEGVGIGTNVALASIGTNFVRPAAGGEYSIVFQGGTLLAPLTNTLKVSSAGQFAVTGGAADKLKLSLSASGDLTGSFLNTNGNKTLKFSGAFISPSSGGSGFIPDANGETGSFDLHQ